MKTIFLLFSIAFFSTVVHSEKIEGKSIGNISTREYVVEILVVDSERRYVVKTKNGEAITNKISAMELANIYPELGKLVQGGLADHAALYRPLATEGRGLIDQL